MTYLPTRRYPLGATSTDLQPGSSSDFIALWTAFKKAMVEKFGTYRFQDNSLATLGGAVQPLATTQQCQVIHDWMIRIAKKAIAGASAAGRSTSSMTSAVSRYETAFSAWKTKRDATSNPNSFGGYMPLALTDQFMNATTVFARDMSTGQWAAFNIGTPLELWNEALSETPGGAALLGIWDAAKALVGAGGFFLANLGTIVKIALVGAAGFVGYRVYKTVKGATES